MYLTIFNFVAGMFGSGKTSGKSAYIFIGLFVVILTVTLGWKLHSLSSENDVLKRDIIIVQTNLDNAVASLEIANNAVVKIKAELAEANSRYDAFVADRAKQKSSSDKAIKELETALTDIRAQNESLKAEVIESKATELANDSDKVKEALKASVILFEGATK